MQHTAQPDWHDSPPTLALAGNNTTASTATALAARVKVRQLCIYQQQSGAARCTHVVGVAWFVQARPEDLQARVLQLRNLMTQGMGREREVPHRAITALQEAGACVRVLNCAARGCPSFVLLSTKCGVLVQYRQDPALSFCQKAQAIGHVLQAAELLAACVSICTTVAASCWWWAACFDVALLLLCCRRVRLRCQQQLLHQGPADSPGEQQHTAQTL